MIKSLKISKKLEDYIAEHSYELNPVQKEIINHNEKMGSQKKMQISVTQGYFFQFFIKSFNIKKVLEIGTFTGYSSLTMALALPKNGHITCLDKNKTTSEIAKNFFIKAGIQKKIDIFLGPALDNLIKLVNDKKKFDMVFIDADKDNYKKYFDLSLKLINKKSFILIDNVLWHGDVADPNKNDKLTNILRDFNSFIKNDDRIHKTILPLGDGITICRKF